MPLPKTKIGLTRRLNQNKKQIMQLENDIFVHKHHSTVFEDMEDIEDAKALMQSLLDENKVIKEKINETKNNPTK